MFFKSPPLVRSPKISIGGVFKPNRTVYIFYRTSFIKTENCDGWNLCLILCTSGTLKSLAVFGKTLSTKGNLDGCLKKKYLVSFGRNCTIEVKILPCDTKFMVTKFGFWNFDMTFYHEMKMYQNFLSLYMDFIKTVKIL